MVLCSYFESISPCQAPFWNMSLAARTKQWTARNLQKLCAHRNLAPTFVPDRECKVETLYSGTFTVPEFQRKYLKKLKDVFTLVPNKYRTRTPCPGTKCESCLRGQGLKSHTNMIFSGFLFTNAEAASTTAINFLNLRHFHIATNFADRVQQSCSIGETRSNRSLGECIRYVCQAYRRVTVEGKDWMFLAIDKYDYGIF